MALVLVGGCGVGWEGARLIGLRGLPGSAIWCNLSGLWGAPPGLQVGGRLRQVERFLDLPHEEPTDGVPAGRGGTEGDWLKPLLAFSHHPGDASWLPVKLKAHSLPTSWVGGGEH